MMKKLGLPGFLLVLVAGFLRAQSEGKYKVCTLTGSVVDVRAFVKAPEDSRASATFCIEARAHSSCYTPRSNGKPFFIDPIFTAGADANGNVRWFVFSAKREPFFSRQDRMITLLFLNGSIDLVSALPPIILSEQSEYLVWHRESSSKTLPMVTVADYVWAMERETHFGTHKYRVTTYGPQSSRLPRYRQIDSYITERSYPGLDDESELNVIQEEMATIKARLKKKRVE